MKNKKVIIVGCGNAALCAGIAALEKGAAVQIIEKADEKEAGGNSKYTAGAMRFVYNNADQLLTLLSDPNDERISHTNFGVYSKENFQRDLLGFNNGHPLSLHQHLLIDHSYDTVEWLSGHGIKFEPIYSRQSFKKDGQYVFWGGLTLAAQGEGVGLVDAEMAAYLQLGGTIRYETAAVELLTQEGKITGVVCDTPTGTIQLAADAIVLGCGGFEANPALRKKYMGAEWEQAKVRGTRHNTGKGIEMALKLGAQFYGEPDGCHATPMDLQMPNYGNLDIPFIDRKHYRKICYFLGVMLNANGERFEDEGINFRNYTYAQFGRSILQQPGGFAWQIFDKKVDHLLYSEYRFWDASFVVANTLEELVQKLEGVNAENALQTLHRYNAAVDLSTPFDPTLLDGKSTIGLKLNKTNWANTLDTPPFRAYPVTCGITFTYAGLKVDRNAAVLDHNDQAIQGLYACGELVGGVFYHGYPGGSGLTSGAVFGRIAGSSAAL